MIAEEIASEYPQSTDKIKVIHNGFDPDRFNLQINEREQALKEKLGAPDANTLTFLCQWVEDERSQPCTRACLPNQSESECHLWVIGRGNQNHYTKQCND